MRQSTRSQNEVRERAVRSARDRRALDTMVPAAIVSPSLQIPA